MTGITPVQSTEPVPPVFAAPPAPPLPLPPVAPPPPSRPGARVVAIAMIVVGGLVAVGTIGWAAVGGIGSLSRHTTQRTTTAAGVDHLRLDVGAADLRIEFADVSDVELQVTGRYGSDRWTLNTEGSDLVVASDGQDFGGPFGRGDEAVLRLPQRLAGLDADLTVQAGDLTLDGEFGALSLELGAGDATVDVDATTFALQLEAGDVDLSLTDVETADFTVSAGDLSADLFGGQPRSVSVDASAADVTVTVAPGSYRLTGDATDSDLVDTDLVSDAGAASTIDARVSASDVTIASAR